MLLANSHGSPTSGICSPGSRRLGFGRPKVGVHTASIPDATAPTPGEQSERAQAASPRGEQASERSSAGPPSPGGQERACGAGLPTPPVIPDGATGPISMVSENCFASHRHTSSAGRHAGIDVGVSCPTSVAPGEALARTRAGQPATSDVIWPAGDEEWPGANVPPWTFPRRRDQRGGQPRGHSLAFPSSSQHPGGKTPGPGQPRRTSSTVRPSKRGGLAQARTDLPSVAARRLPSLRDSSWPHREDPRRAGAGRDRGIHPARRFVSLGPR